MEPEVRRQEILEAAERLLTRDGPRVRVQDVVREAGAAKGTFYLYFPTWDDLLDAIRERLVVAFDAAYPIQIDGHAQADWPGLLEGLAVNFVEAIIGMGGLHPVLCHSDFAQRRPMPPSDDPINRLTAVIRAGQKAGAFARMDAGLTGRLLFAVIHETADALEHGEDRESVLAAMRWILRRALQREAQ
ncbi:MAG: TetR/AcrR family transcriptional regulator [Alphaproteobacteria bacterium]|nr:TetR/AcrR family transcriptional regulator [Alphaproteobacteria bacterium]MCW5739688.1 TetR/AcrR family transcriptional regulator [Alphaproteobacteria bacterium]